jgi:tRNA(Ile)-lysidine synthase
MTPTALPAMPRNRRTAAFERRVARALDALVERDTPLVVACSGGPDSLATLVAVARARPSGSVVAAHFDHRLRPAPEVATERARVESVAGAVGAPMLSGRAQRIPTDRSEAAAREARYRWLARACVSTGAPACVTGHTLDDQAETVLLRLARGTGLRGAGGMEPLAPWPLAVRGRSPLLVRPLLEITRGEIEAYLDALQLEASRDPSNDTLDYARNRVRQRVLPELRALNPRVARQIAAFANRAREDDAALDAWATAAFGDVAMGMAGGIALDRLAVLGLPPAVASRVVRLASTALGLSIDGDGVEATLHAARARGRRAALGGGFEARREGATLVLGQPAVNSSKSSVHPLALRGSGATIFKLPRTGSQNT